jgi:hypothetical protein
MREQQNNKFNNQPSRFSAWRLFVSPRSPLFEIACVLVRFDHVARFVVNANHGIV